jgi:hypothetical protein
MEATRRFVAFTSSDTGKVPVAGNVYVTLDFGDTSTMMVAVAERRRKFVLDRVEVLRATGASVTAHTALVADVTGSVAAAWATKYASAAVAAATRLDQNQINGTMYTSTEGKLFFTPGGDAADTFNYEVWFEVLQ